MDEQLKSNLTSRKHWMRLVYMLLFALLLQVASAVLWVLVLVQFLFALITGNDNLNLRRLGDSLSTYIYRTLRFLTYNTDDKPFPFADWPESEGAVEPDEAPSVVEGDIDTEGGEAEVEVDAGRKATKSRLPRTRQE